MGATHAKLHMRNALVSTIELFGVSQGWILKKKLYIKKKRKSILLPATGVCKSHRRINLSGFAQASAAWKLNGLFIESSLHLLLNYNLSFFFHPPLFICLGNSTNWHTLNFLLATHTGPWSGLAEAQLGSGHAQVAAHFSCGGGRYALNDNS